MITEKLFELQKQKSLRNAKYSTMFEKNKKYKYNSLNEKFVA